ncbi:hypothetical protein DID76_00600 [Candidatus Marinamargulisbacteria bacterium SCGC AG-414-C22]|nr:hypothetical protein DID76_00600 [Candidatus Marinamargulisbacteria bacterium SCGC AG-414-C22]
MKRGFMLCVAMILCVLLSADKYAQSKNLIYIVMEGTSRSTLYSLIKKDKLPHVQKIIERGNYRNVETTTLNSYDDDLYLSLLLPNTVSPNRVTTSNMTSKTTIFDVVHETMPSVAISILYTPPDSLATYPLTQAVITTKIQQFPTYSMQQKVSSYDVGKKAAAIIEQHSGAFMLFLNYTNVNRVGLKYREGGELYSQAVFNVDRSIGLMINALEAKKQWENTEFLVVTNYGMVAKTKEKSHKTWVLSTQKALRKGTIFDILPSALSLLDKDEMLKDEASASLFKINNRSNSARKDTVSEDASAAVIKKTDQ